MVCLSTASVFSTKVQQSPSNVIKATGDSVDLWCAHSIPSYNVMLWYKPSRKKGLVLLGHLLVKGPSSELKMNNKITLKGEGNKNGSITIRDLSVNDGAMYFCGLCLHSAADRVTTGKKNSIYQL